MTRGPSDTTRLPTPYEARSLAEAFDRARLGEPDIGLKLRYALARNAMQALAAGSLARPVGNEEAEDFVRLADTIFNRIEAGELNAKAAVNLWRGHRNPLSLTPESTT